MGRGRYVVDAVVVEGHAPGEVGRSHGLSLTWVDELVARGPAERLSPSAPRSGAERRPAAAMPPPPRPLGVRRPTAAARSRW